MFQLNSWNPLLGDSSKLAVRNAKNEPVLREGCGRLVATRTEIPVGRERRNLDPSDTAS